MKVLVSGATGFIGRQIIKDLRSLNHEVFGLNRNIEKAQKINPEVIWIEWANFNVVLDLKPFGHIDAVINLVGENLADKRWSNEQKKILYNSRIDSTKSIAKMIENSQGKVDIFIQTSAIGIYGNRMSEEIHEKSLVVDDYIGKLCCDWEKSLIDNPVYKRHVILRIGLVLGKNGGLMEKLLPIFQLGLGGKLGSGSHYMSWIHIKDLSRIIQRGLSENEMKGIYNATAPFPVKNKEFTKYLGKVLNKPTFFAVPGFVLKAVMGEMAEHVLSGARVVPRKLKEDGFHFIYPTLELSLKDVVSKEKK